MNRKPFAVIALTALSFSVLAGCSTPQPDAKPSEAAGQLPEKCLTPTEGAIQALEADIKATIGDVEFKGNGVIKSESGDDFWYIAVEFDGETSGTGTWGTMQDPTTENDIAYVAVDDMAPLVSTYKQPIDFKGMTSSLVGADDCIA